MSRAGVEPLPSLVSDRMYELVEGSGNPVTLHATEPLRDTGHQQLGIARLRYGVRFTELCELVRNGLDRTYVGTATPEWLDLGRYESWSTTSSSGSP